MLDTMASLKSKKTKEGKTFRLGKFKFAKKHTTKSDKIDLEDSGVHLDETCLAAGLCDDNSDVCGSRELLMTASPATDVDQLCQDLDRKCDTGSPPGGDTCQIRTMGPNPRSSKSEIPHPAGFKTCVSTPSCMDAQSEKVTFTTTKTTTTPALRNRVRLTSSRTVGSPPITPEGDSGKVTFTFGSDIESDGDSFGLVTSRKSASPTWVPPRSNNRDKDRSNKSRFKKILRPLRRSHSAGCTKDAPAHALFLRHDIEKSRRTPDRRSIDTGRGSMERQSSDSDSEEQMDKSKSAGKTKKKSSLARDMKEKFAFLRRRHTDTALSGKDKAAVPTGESALHWSKSFETLLMDKCGLDMFREFLRTEFSEENIEFWIACEEYKDMKSNKLEARAQTIFTDFVAVQAAREINLDSKTREETALKMSQPDRYTFEVAQKRIQALMEKDSYPRFLRSDVYQELLGDHKIHLKVT